MVTEAEEGVQLECLLRMFRISVAAGVGEAVLGALPPASGMKNMNFSWKQHSIGPGPMLCPQGITSSFDALDNPNDRPFGR